MAPGSRSNGRPRGRPPLSRGNESRGSIRGGRGRGRQIRSLDGSFSLVPFQAPDNLPPMPQDCFESLEEQAAFLDGNHVQSELNKFVCSLIFNCL